jgi:hypothetical protein
LLWQEIAWKGIFFSRAYDASNEIFREISGFEPKKSYHQQWTLDTNSQQWIPMIFKSFLFAILVREVAK